MQSERHRAVCQCRVSATNIGGVLSGDRLLLWPPTMHTATKLADIAQELSLETTWGEGRSWLTVHFPEQPGLQEFLRVALDRLTEEELDSTQALVGTAASPLAAEIPSIEPPASPGCRTGKYLVRGSTRHWTTHLRLPTDRQRFGSSNRWLRGPVACPST
jgi:hypothetical protein